MRDMTEDEGTIEQKRLTARIVLFLGRDMTGRNIEKIEEVIKEHRRGCRMRGLNFPELVAIVMPTSGNLEIIPREQDRAGIETLIVNLARKWPSVTADELGFAINRAFPEYAKLIGAAEKAKGFVLS